MADLSDVQDVLAQLASEALYPNGTSQPSPVGVTVTVVPGWPIPKQLDSIIAAGNAMVSVYQMGGMGKNTTRFLGDSAPVASIPAAQLTLTVQGNTVTVGGTVNAGESPMLKVNYRPYAYEVQQSDTLATIAAALAALVPGASVSGTVITLGDIFDVRVAVSVPVPMAAEIGRQAQVFMLTTWAPTPDTRKVVNQTIELSFKEQPRILMPDNTWARLLYRGTIEQDTLQRQRIYRRNLLYEVEYALMATQIGHTVTDFGVTTSTASGASNITHI